MRSAPPAPRSFAGATAIGAGIDFAMKQFPRSGVDSPRRVIDVSGDGDNNSGKPVEYARDAAVAEKVTINGLAIINEHPAAGFIGHVQPEGGIGSYYRTRVAGGPDSFVIEIDSFAGFAEAMTRKAGGGDRGEGGRQGSGGALNYRRSTRPATASRRSSIAGVAGFRRGDDGIFEGAVATGGQAVRDAAMRGTTAFTRARALSAFARSTRTTISTVTWSWSGCQQSKSVTIATVA